MRTHLTILLAFLTCNMSAQPDISRNVLRQGFERQYIQHCEKPDMSSYDKLSIWAGIMADKEDKDYHWYINKITTLRQAGRFLLPPSMYYAENMNTPNYGMERKTDKDSIALYWIGSLNNYKEKEDAELRNKLKRIYGSILLEDSIEAIPAKWFSGELSISRNPDWYGGFLICSLQKKISFHSGISVPYIDIAEDVSAIGSLYYDYMRISKIRPDIINTGDNPFRLEAMLQVHSLNLLARDLSRSFSTSYPQDSTRWNEYPILITTDNEHKSHIEALYPDSLDEKGQCLIQSLSETMEKQPAGILSESRMIDGRTFNVLFVRAIYNTVTKQWMFIEYPRTHFRPGKKVDRWNKGRKGYDNR